MGPCVLRGAEAFDTAARAFACGRAEPSAKSPMPNEDAPEFPHYVAWQGRTATRAIYVQMTGGPVSGPVTWARSRTNSFACFRTKFLRASHILLTMRMNQTEDF